MSNLISRCPLCGGDLNYKKHNYTHIYVCVEACPFVGFEYLTDSNTVDLTSFLKRKTNTVNK